MGFPRATLGSDEDILLHRHPHWKMLVVPAVTLLVATAGLGFLVGLAGRSLDPDLAWPATLGAVALWTIFVLWRTVLPVWRWRTTHFVVTDRRVLVRQGVFRHSGIDVPVRSISNVQFRHGVIDRMMKTGTLVIVSMSDDPLEFDDVPDIERVHSLLYHQAFDDGDGRVEESGVDSWTS